MQTAPICEIIERIGEREQTRAIMESARKTFFTTKEECKALLVPKNKLNATIEEENDDDEDTEI